MRISAVGESQMTAPRLELILRFIVEGATQEKPVRCYGAELDVFPSLYICKNDVPCRHRVLFGMYAYCGYELNRLENGKQ